MGKWNHLYALPVWRQLRASHLRTNPLCVKCEEEGIANPGNTVDHRVPHKGNMELFLDPTNFDTLCATHHSSTKQMEERHGYAPGANEDGTPADPRHPWFRHQKGAEGGRGG